MSRLHAGQPPLEPEPLRLREPLIARRAHDDHTLACTQMTLVKAGEQTKPCWGMHRAAPAAQFMALSAAAQEPATGILCEAPARR